jgi:hypothetical protein
VVGHILVGREGAVASEYVDYELYICQFILGRTQRREAYSLRNIQTNDTLEREEFEENSVLQQLGLVAAVEAQAAEDRKCGDDELEDRDPQVGEVDAVGLSAILTDSEGDNGADPNDDAGGDELEDAVPDALELC